jgi:predicted aspartyl protease
VTGLSVSRRFGRGGPHRRAFAGASLSLAAFGGAAPARADEAADGVGVHFEGPDQSSGRLPLTLDQASRLRVSAIVQGVEVLAILDTGAARTVIDRSFAERLGLAGGAGYGMTGLTAPVQGSLASGVSISLGRLTLAKLSVGVFDLGALSRVSGGAPVAVVIGQELFQAVGVDLDLANLQAEFVGPARLPPLPQSATAPLRRTARGSLYMPASLERGPPIQASLDIGYNAALLVSPDHAETCGLLEGRPVSTVSSAGVEGVSISRVATLGEVSLAGTTLRDVPVEVPQHWNHSLPAVIGLDVLEKFRVLTDYSRGRVCLLADPGRVATPLSKDRSGIGAVPTGEGLKVVHVAEHSPAEGAGLKAGDCIGWIDGVRVDPAYLRGHRRMGTMPAGSVFLLGLADGRAVRLTLADYY